MIKTRDDLKYYLNQDNIYYRNKGKKQLLKLWILRDHDILIRKYVKLLRKDEYYSNNRSSLLNKIKCIFYKNRKNSLGNKLGFYIIPNSFKEGLTIYHHGNIIVNGNARIGKNCKLHGDNCIGNNGFSKKAPVIGDNVDIGVGAKIIGDVYIADDIIIGANAVVNKSFYEKGITIAGIPARKIK